jgi:PII-like signaling protein
MRLHGPAMRLTVFVDETDQWHHRPVYAEIVHRARDAGLAGASVLRGIEGYGASTRIHSNHLLTLGEKLPVAVIIVDDEPAIRAFLPRVDEVVDEGLVVLDAIEVYRYVALDSDRMADRHRHRGRPHWPRRAFGQGRR